MSLDSNNLSQHAIDRFLEIGDVSLFGSDAQPYRPPLVSAKIGWARPDVLSLNEVQALCKALVMLEAETGMVSKCVV